jgi:hypothetical protein
MGSTSDTQPPQLTVDNTGMITFNTTGVALGYWSTQIKVSDGLCYVVVDFIINVTVCIKLNGSMCFLNLLPLAASSWFPPLFAPKHTHRWVNLHCLR